MGRRRRKRKPLPKPQEAKLQLPPEPLSQLQPQALVPLWKRIPAWAYVALGMLAALIGIIQSYPFFSCTEGARLQPSDPYSQMFVLTNEGYIPVTNPQISCLYQMKIVEYGTSTFISIPIMPVVSHPNILAHGGRVTASCYAQVKGITVVPGSKLDVTINYAFWHMDFSWLRRSQTFHLQSVGGADNTVYWQFM